MKNRILSIILAMVMIFTMIPAYSISSFALVSGDFEYKVLDETEKTASITKYTGSATELEFPSQIDGYTVTEINLSNFFFANDFVNVIIPNGVTKIGSYAFNNCSSLTSVTLPDSLISIGSSAFSGCEALETVFYGGSEEDWSSIEIASGNDYLNDATIAYNCSNNMFEYELLDDGTAKITGVKSSPINLEIPSEVDGYTVTAIGDSAFFESSAKKVVLPETVTSIGSCSFLEMSNLTEIIIPDSVTYFGNRAFEGTAFYNNTSNWEDGVLYIGNHLIKASNETPSEYVIKSGTKTIAASAFETCNSITSVVIPDSMTSISKYAFFSCKTLASVTIPDSVTLIDEEAFSYCDSLTSVTIPDSVTKIGYSAFYNCVSLNDIIIPDSVTSIGGGAFTETAYVYDESNWEAGVVNNGALYIGNHLIGTGENFPKKYEVKEGTITIADWTFYRCEQLIAITLPDSLITIGYAAFARCSALRNVKLGKNLKTISYGAFMQCESLYNIVLPDGLTTIESYAFDGLLSLTIPGSVTTIGENAVCDTNIIVLLEGITAIPEFAFSECSSLTTVVIPRSVTSIGASAFVNCSSINNVTYYGSEEQWNAIDIGENNGCLKNATILFDGDNYDFEYEVLEDGTAKITRCIGFPIEIEVPSEIDGYTVTAIGDGAFAECPAITMVLPDTITSIGEMSFYGMAILKEITIPDSVKTIGMGAFAGCLSLTDIVISDGVVSIGDLALYSCISLENINVSANNENYCSIDGVLFNKDATILIQYPAGRIQFEYIIPEPVETICEGAFEGQKDIRTLTIHKNLKTVGNSNFRYTWLEKINYSGTKCQWDAITIGESNDDLLGATINYALGEHAYGEYEFPTEAGLGVMGEAKHTCEYCGNEESCTYQLGDVDGDELYTENDYAMIIQASACGIALTEEQIIMADIDGDGAVDTFDAMALDMYMN